jgi:hypothetical protein
MAAAFYGYLARLGVYKAMYRFGSDYRNQEVGALLGDQIAYFIRTVANAAAAVSNPMVKTYVQMRR